MPQTPRLPASDGRLVRKLAIILLIKLVAIFTLWWLFVREERVPVAPETVARHLWQTPDPSSQGNPHGQ